VENKSLSFKDSLKIVLNSLGEGLITKKEALDEIMDEAKKAVINVTMVDEICIGDAEALYEQYGVYLNCDNGKVSHVAMESGC